MNVLQGPSINGRTTSTRLWNSSLRCFILTYASQSHQRLRQLYIKALRKKAEKRARSARKKKMSLTTITQEPPQSLIQQLMSRQQQPSPRTDDEERPSFELDESSPATLRLQHERQAQQLQHKAKQVTQHRIASFSVPTTAQIVFYGKFYSDSRT